MKVVVRIRAAEKRLREDGRPNRAVALWVSAVAWPLGVACYFACAWRWAFDLGWVGRFLVTEGVWSHWQVWFVAGTVGQILAVVWKRYGEPGSDAVTSTELLRKELP